MVGLKLVRSARAAPLGAERALYDSAVFIGQLQQGVAAAAHRGIGTSGARSTSSIATPAEQLLASEPRAAGSGPESTDGLLGGGSSNAILAYLREGTRFMPRISLRARAGARGGSSSSTATSPTISCSRLLDATNAADPPAEDVIERRRVDGASRSRQEAHPLSQRRYIVGEA